MDYHIEISHEENEEFSDFLKNRIREYNDQSSPFHAQMRTKGTVKPINIMVTDEKNDWIGGITAEVYWNWVEIHYFWFQETYRTRGLGSLLLEKTEELAREKGAEKALLTTYEFQARAFYERKGYQVVGEIKDYPPGSSYYTLVKILK